MGVLSHLDTSVTVINRTIGAGKYERDLSVRFDGEETKLHPGENPGFPRIAVPFAKRQNVLMGTRHPTNPTLYISLVGIKGEDSEDECRPLTVEELEYAATKPEAIDRSGEYHGEPLRQNVRLDRKRGFTPFEASVGGGIGDTGFAGGSGVID